jgi:repressor LexA
MVTFAQRKIYDFICAFIQEYGHSPSFKEIAQGVGISQRSVSLISRSVQSLTEAGWLTASKHSHRSIQIKKSGEILLPLLGKIAAGSPIEAISDQKTIDISGFLTGNQFALKVKGDSMVDEGILDGDFVICKSTQIAREGDIVVALIDGSHATLKRISYQLRNMIALIPANVHLKPKAYLPQRIQIQGVYMGLLRLNK